MQAKTNTVWFNRMPMIGEGEHSLPSILIAIEPDEVLPEGTHSVEVVLKGPDGKERTAHTTLEVGHAE